MARKIEIDLPYTKEEIESMDWLSYKHCVLNPIARKMIENEPMTETQKLSEEEFEGIKVQVSEFLHSNLSESSITSMAFEFPRA